VARKVLTLLVLAAGFVLLAQPAIAIGWGPESTYYKGIKRATGFGDFKNEGNTRAWNKITVTDEDDDGNAVYGVTNFYFRYTACETNYGTGGTDCTEDFRREDRQKTEEFKNDERTFDHRMSLLPTASRARAETFACVQMGWPVPDGCASAAYPTFDY
jgi:hypothetical protein